MLDMHSRPSEILGLEDSYTAFCFDEACSLILKKLKDGEKPIIKENGGNEKHYKKPSDLYNKYKV